MSGIEGGYRGPERHSSQQPSDFEGIADRKEAHLYKLDSQGRLTQRTGLRRKVAQLANKLRSSSAKQRNAISRANKLFRQFSIIQAIKARVPMGLFHRFFPKTPSGGKVSTRQVIQTQSLIHNLQNVAKNKQRLGATIAEMAIYDGAKFARKESHKEVFRELKGLPDELKYEAVSVYVDYLSGAHPTEKDSLIASFKREVGFEGKTPIPFEQIENRTIPAWVSGSEVSFAQDLQAVFKGPVAGILSQGRPLTSNKMQILLNQLDSVGIADTRLLGAKKLELSYEIFKRNPHEGTKKQFLSLYNENSLSLLPEKIQVDMQVEKRILEGPIPGAPEPRPGQEFSKEHLQTQRSFALLVLPPSTTSVSNFQLSSAIRDVAKHSSCESFMRENLDQLPKTTLQAIAYEAIALREPMARGINDALLRRVCISSADSGDAERLNSLIHASGHAHLMSAQDFLMVMNHPPIGNGLSFEHGTSMGLSANLIKVKKEAMREGPLNLRRAASLLRNLGSFGRPKEISRELTAQLRGAGVPEEKLTHVQIAFALITQDLNHRHSGIGIQTSHYNLATGFLNQFDPRLVGWVRQNILR